MSSTWSWNTPGATYRPLSRGKPHPRTYGTCARILGKYVRKGTLSWEIAVSKMTSLPAEKLGLFDRGLTRPGCVADLVLFSPGGDSRHCHLH
ncbi:MAG: hypothetical protein AB1445_01745 [Bacillota bacterium]